MGSSRDGKKHIAGLNPSAVKAQFGFSPRVSSYKVQYI